MLISLSLEMPQCVYDADAYDAAPRVIARFCAFCLRCARCDDAYYACRHTHTLLLRQERRAYAVSQRDTRVLDVAARCCLAARVTCLVAVLQVAQ